MHYWYESNKNFIKQIDQWIILVMRVDSLETGSSFEVYLRVQSEVDWRDPFYYEAENTLISFEQLTMPVMFGYSWEGIINSIEVLVPSSPIDISLFIGILNGCKRF